MQLEGGKINNFSLLFLIIGFTFGSSVIISPGIRAGRDAWLTILAGLTEGLFFAYIYFTLAGKFPGKNLVEISREIYGPFLGNIISLLYLGYFLHLASLVLRNFGDFFSITIYPQTPTFVIIGLTVLISASAVRNGIEVISRCSLILVPITLLSYLMMTIFLLPQAKITRIQPLMELPFAEFLRISHATATFPFGETVAFLMVTGYINKKSGFSKRFALAGIIIPGFVFTMAAIINTAVLGATAGISLYPTYDAIQLINIGEILTRLEVTITFAMYSMGFIKFSVLYYGAALGTAQVLRLRSYLPLVLPLGIIMGILSITQFESVIENITWANEIYPFYTLPFQLFIPLLSLLLDARQKNKTGSNKAGEKP